MILCASCLLAQDPTFRVDVQLVRLLVTVKDSRGALVSSLAKDEFTVLDNGVKQELTVFERESNQPLSVSLLLDTSASTGIDLKYELESVQKFLRAVFAEGNAKDAVAFYTFNYDVTVHTAYTRTMSRFEQAMKGIKPEGGTSLYDAIYLASQDLDTRDGRHVIVVVTDGGDTTSKSKFREALQAAQMADAVIYSILVVPIPTDPGRNVGGENALETISTQTGGRVFAPTIGARLDQAFTEILRDLRTQYLLGYYPRDLPKTKERFHKLDVSVTRPGHQVVTRTGYYSDGESPGDDPARGPGLIQPRRR